MGSITEVAVLKINETARIREIYRLICELPENPNEIELRTKQETESEWEDVEEIQEADSAYQIDQLNALRFKMQSGKFNMPRSKREKISDNAMMGMRENIPKEETYNKYGGAPRGVELEDIERQWEFARIPFSGIPDGGILK